jgi:hypothetical protein
VPEAGNEADPGQSGVISGAQEKPGPELTLAWVLWRLTRWIFLTGLCWLALFAVVVLVYLWLTPPLPPLPDHVPR